MAAGGAEHERDGNCNVERPHDRQV
jgi:hypothetical protein